MRVFQVGDRVAVWDGITRPEFGTVLERTTPKGGNYVIDVGDGEINADWNELYRESAFDYLIRDMKVKIDFMNTWLEFAERKIKEGGE